MLYGSWQLGARDMPSAQREVWLENAGLQWGVLAGFAATIRPNGLSEAGGKFLKITGVLLE